MRVPQGAGPKTCCWHVEVTQRRGTTQISDPRDGRSCQALSGSMKYDDETRALRFGSPDELRRFHDDLTELLRTATVAATAGVEVAVATERAREVMRRHAPVVRALNAIRRALPREVPDPSRPAAHEAPDEPDEG